MARKKRGQKKGKLKKMFVPRNLFIILLIIAIIFSGLNIAEAKGWLIPKQPTFEIEDGVINLDSLSLEQKIAQMVIVSGLKDNYVPWRRMQIGGIHLFALQTENIFNNTIIDFQYEMPIPFFVTADLEGCITPFGHIKNFTAASEVKSLGEAFEKGFREGEFLKRLGFTLNFAPVVDLDDKVWNCRTYPGNEDKIAEYAQAYVLGLQNQGIIGTAKHYPGKTLVGKDPHKLIVAAQIDGKDIFPYQYLSDRGDVKAIMVSHIISLGEINSKGVPAVVSKEVIDNLREDFDGLIISDEIHMLGLKSFFETVDEMYIAVFKGGSDIILNFDRNPNEVYRMIKIVAEAVENGEIDEDRIDASVTRILEAKEFRVR